MAVPKAPPTPTATPEGRGLKLSWGWPNNGGKAITRFRLQRSRYSDFSTTGSVELASTTIPATYTHDDTTLPRGVTFYFRVRAQNADGWGPYGGVRSYTLPILVPSAPLNVLSGTVTATSFEVKWTPPSFNGGQAITEYQVQRALNSAFTSGVWTSGVLSSSSRSYTFSAAAKNTQYYTRVRASNAERTSSNVGGWGPWSSWAAPHTLTTPPVLVDQKTAVNISASSVTIQGGAILDNGGKAPTHFRIAWATNPAGTGYQTLYPPPGPNQWVQVTVPGLASNTTYYYKRSAANTVSTQGAVVQWGPWTNTWQPVTTAMATLTTPEFGDVSPDDAEVSFQWRVSPTYPQGTVTATLRCSRNADMSNPVATQTVDAYSNANVNNGWNVAVFDGLRSGTKYYFSLVLNRASDAAASAAVYMDATTTGDPPVETGTLFYTYVDGELKPCKVYIGVAGEIKELDISVGVGGEIKPIGSAT